MCRNGVIPTADRGVRYRADVGFEMRCDDCAAAHSTIFYWPMTTEFWDPHRGMQRCRACSKRVQRQQHREMYRNHPDWRVRKLAANREYKKAAAEALRIKRLARKEAA